MGRPAASACACRTYLETTTDRKGQIVKEKSADRTTANRTTDTLAFFKGFLSHPETVASVVPSSRFLERRIIDAADIRNARLVVELGPGTGGTTRAILNSLPPTGRLLTIELNPDFIRLLNRIDDPRLINHAGNATDIRKILQHYGLPNPDVVISGIPFSTMPASTGKAILNAMWASLMDGGRFVAYQFRNQVALLGRELFGNPDVTMELRNAPPMRVYRWYKTADAPVAVV
jgi:phosphatidylethanolamine/phosphatidyl-N-methylethanolamine N-methyltransferase